MMPENVAMAMVASCKERTHPTDMKRKTNCVRVWTMSAQVCAQVKFIMEGPISLNMQLDPDHCKETKTLDQTDTHSNICQDTHQNQANTKHKTHMNKNADEQD